MMKRRSFIRTTAISATAVTVLPAGGAAAATLKKRKKMEKTFNLLYAPHIGMFKSHAGSDPVDELKFMYDQGFRAFEDNNMRTREVAVQEKMASTMATLGIQMGVFVAHTINWKEPTLTTGLKEHTEAFLSEIRGSVEVAKRVNAKYMTVVPGFVEMKLAHGYQTVNVVENLRRACEILEPHGLVMVLEPLNFFNHPGLFLKEIPQAYEVCRAVNSPSCKILFDIYHQQIQEGNLIPNMEKAWSEIGYFQCGDNPGRKEPTTGEINYLNVFKYIYEKDKRFIIGMEHGNSKPGKEGELAVIEAYRKVDAFL
jgi:hydroxypyruvate isomerase